MGAPKGRRESLELTSLLLAAAAAITQGHRRRRNRLRRLDVGIQDCKGLGVMARRTRG